jgi:hypothetical protein
MDQMAGPHKYFVAVTPGVDLALFAPISVCFNKANNESD